MCPVISTPLRVYAPRLVYYYLYAAHDRTCVRAQLVTYDDYIPVLYIYLFISDIHGTVTNPVMALTQSLTQATRTIIIRSMPASACSLQFEACVYYLVRARLAIKPSKIQAWSVLGPARPSDRFRTTPPHAYSPTQAPAAAGIQAAIYFYQCMPWQCGGGRGYRAPVCGAAHAQQVLATHKQSPPLAVSRQAMNHVHFPYSTPHTHSKCALLWQVSATVKVSTALGWEACSVVPPAR